MSDNKENTNGRHRATHLGYLNYHLTVLSDRLTELDRELDVIRKDTNNSDKEQYKKERDELLNFRKEVRKRLKQSTEQLDGALQHESDDVTERAQRQSDSCYTTHQANEAEELSDGEGFVAASSLTAIQEVRDNE